MRILKKISKKLLTQNRCSYIILTEQPFGMEGIHMKKKLYLKSPSRLIGSIALAMFFIIALMFMFRSVSYGESIPEYTTVVVAKGDTLWTIAKEYYDCADVRSKVNEIKELNNMTNSTIKEGQEIILRVG